jgi:hypothetical protein
MPPISKWRLAILTGLLAAPVLLLLGLGCWWLWLNSDIAFWLWWPMAACLALASLLSWYWQRSKQLLPPPDFQPSLAWTDRDRAAWQLVTARAEKVNTIDPDRMTVFQFYVDTAQEMARELAAFYHPKAKDPVGSLTIPEVLAVVELAAGDLAEMVDKYLPGGHLLTLDQWRSAPKYANWYRVGSMAFWAISALFNPVKTVVRYTAAQLGVSQPFQMLQDNIVAWFYTAYIHRVGTYLIEVNSGRLRVGAKRYRELVAHARLQDGVATEPLATLPSDGAAPLASKDGIHTPTVRLTVLGQVKAGKSSLINAFLGEQRAATDVLPLTSEITRYQLQPSGIGSSLVLLDTVGYAHEGPKADQLKATHRAAQESDLILLVLHGRDPARQPDLKLLQGLRSWFREHPELKLPPILGVLTHIDLLPPLLEWAPPYNWLAPVRPKEKSIAEAIEAAQEALGDHLVGIVPICVAEEKTYGVQEWLLPRTVELLGEARAVGLLRCLKAEANASRVRKLLNQLLEASKQLWQITAGSAPPGGGPPTVR